MKATKMLLVFLFLFTIFLSAEETISDDNKYLDIKKEQKNKEVSIIQLLEYYLIQANNLEITDDQRERLSDLPKKYIYPMTIKNAEYEISVLDVVDILTNPNFNTAELKSALKKSKAQALEMSLLSVDAIDEIRQIIGLDNFTIIMKAMKMKK